MSSHRASPPIPITVPTVSKKSESMIEKIASAAPRRPSRTKTSRLTPAPSVEKSGQATTDDGTTATPGVVHTAPPRSALTAIARSVVPRIPSRSAARTPRARRRSVRSSPTTATATFALVKAPSVTGMPWPGRTIPPFTRPMKRMKRPIPTEMARLSASGMAFSTASRTPISTRTVMSTPSQKITPMAAGHGSPCAAISWKATTAFSPMPDATARG